MTDSTDQLLSDLAKKYTYENFDFKNKSIEDLHFAYQQNLDKLKKVVSTEKGSSWIKNS